MPTNDDFQIRLRKFSMPIGGEHFRQPDWGFHREGCSHAKNWHSNSRKSDIITKNRKTMNVIRNSSKVVMWILVLMIAFTGCKSKKKAAEAARAAEERARMEQEANLRKEEERKKKEAEDAARAEAERRQQEMLANAPKAKLNQYFQSISSSNNAASANASINEALTLFASPDTPVLIVISEENGQKDYDRPTTIRQYLNYLKDTKNNANSISNLQFDGSGKITEVELKKN